MTDADNRATSSSSPLAVIVAGRFLYIAVRRNGVLTCLMALFLILLVRIASAGSGEPLAAPNLGRLGPDRLRELTQRSDEMDPWVQSLLDQLDGDRWFQDVSELASFDCRISSSQLTAVGEWIAEQFAALPNLEVTRRSFPLAVAEGSVGHNVVATLRGSRRPDEWYIVGGHYDAVSEAPRYPAPGAEDNASGCAGVLEVARAFSVIPPPVTMQFICYSGHHDTFGQYRGLGSLDHVEDLAASGDISKVKAVLILDMIGYTKDDELGCYLAGSDGVLDQNIEDALGEAAERYTALRTTTDRFLSYTDHASYIDAGMVAAAIIADNYRDYPHYHSQYDTPDNLTIEMGYQIMRLVVATLGEMISYDVMPQPRRTGRRVEPAPRPRW